MNPKPPATEEAREQTQAEAPQAPAPENDLPDNWREIKKLLRFTPRRHPIHQLANRKTGRFISSAFAPTQLYKILRDAPEYQWRERTAAALALREISMSPAQARSAARVLGGVMNNLDAEWEIKRNGKRGKPCINWG